MYLAALFTLLGSMIPLVSGEFYVTVEQIKRTFGSENCIKGSFSEFTIKSESSLFLKEVDSSVTHIANVSSAEPTFGKSTLSELHELAQYNEIDYFYKLEEQEGPPHNRIFTVILTLGDEQFTGSGPSLKKAQHDAANIALDNTDYELPPPNKDTKPNQDAVTPTVLLNNLSAQLGIKVKYYIVEKEKEDLSSLNFMIDVKSKKSYLQKLNESLYEDNNLHVKREESQAKGPFKVSVEVGDTTFYGISYTILSARHEAASKAIDHLLKQIQEGNLACVKDDSSTQCKQEKANIKSPISAVYEAANLRNLDISFDIIAESGPSHKKTFVTECRLGHLTTAGEGKSKKESKRAAAMKMLDRMAELPEVPPEVQIRSLLKDKKSKTKKKKKIIKIKFDVINMHINNIVESIVDFSSFSTSHQEEKSSNKKPKTKKPAIKKKSYQDEILELSNLLNLEVQFMDINDKTEQFTLMSLHINPEYFCFGHGQSKRSAREAAAKEGLKLLQGIHFPDYFLNKRHVVLESEVKERIRSLLNQEISETTPEDPLLQ